MPLWMALVWAVHALVVMLEWCFTIDLLDSARRSSVAGACAKRRRRFTEPVAGARAVGGRRCWSLYNGLVRRRVAETLGQALLDAAR